MKKNIIVYIIGFLVFQALCYSMYFTYLQNKYLVIAKEDYLKDVFDLISMATLGSVY